MGKLIDVDAFLDDVAERYCKDCERRKGIKNGKKKFIYDIGDAPCRACEVDDMKYELESAPTVDAVLVVRCKYCIYKNGRINSKGFEVCDATGMDITDNDFCSWGEKRRE